jgi:uncharacterized membrane protein
MGQQGDRDVPVEDWAATAVYWVVMTFTLVAFLNALNLEVVSRPLNNFLEQIFQYLPRIGGAALLLGVAWALATVVKILVTQGLSRFNLDDRLGRANGADRGRPLCGQRNHRQRSLLVHLSPVCALGAKRPWICQDC